jgi:hypothetical protein
MKANCLEIVMACGCGVKAPSVTDEFKLEGGEAASTILLLPQKWLNTGKLGFHSKPSSLS